MSTLYIGLMSGTSLDGIDAALVRFESEQCQLGDTHFLPFPANLKSTLLTLQQASDNELEIAALAANDLSKLYAQAVQQLLEKTGLEAKQIAAIGNHGQTIRHRPELGFTTQIGNNALLAELTNISVVGDFRSRDVAAGGQGAPLVPAFHQAVFGSHIKNRVVINIGGIANVSYLPANRAAGFEPVIGLDTGPGNVLIDYWTQLNLGKSYDADGAWASTGVVHDSFLDNMLAAPYFAQTPPKSTGRDLFNAHWLQQHLLYPHTRPQDIARTLTMLTAQSIYQAIARFCTQVDEAYVCGGGAHNRLLMSDLQTLFGTTPVRSTEALGIHPDWVEAACFAWLAKQTLANQPANLPAVTGATGLRVLGAIYTA